MAMTKKEQAEVEARLAAAASESEALRTRLALRWTEPVPPDVPVPTIGGPSTGWLVIRGGVEPGWSFGVSHGTGVYHRDRSGRQGGVSLYSTKERALRALRSQEEARSAAALRAIDLQIEAALAKR